MPLLPQVLQSGCEIRTYWVHARKRHISMFRLPPYTLLPNITLPSIHGHLKWAASVGPEAKSASQWAAPHPEWGCKSPEIHIQDSFLIKHTKTLPYILKQGPMPCSGEKALGNGNPYFFLFLKNVCACVRACMQSIRKRGTTSQAM